MDDKLNRAPPAWQHMTPATVPGGQILLRCADGRQMRIGWPEFGQPMFYPIRFVQIADGKLRLEHCCGADGDVVEEIDLEFRWTMGREITTVQPYIMYGQSLAMNLGHDQPLTGTPVAPGRALRYANAGAGPQMSVSERPGKDQRDFGPCHFPQSDLDVLDDLKEERGESPVSSAVAGFLPGLADDVGVVATSHARGGVAIRKLLPRRLSGSSGIQYAGLLRSTVRTRQFCDAYGCEMRTPIMSFIHGEAFRPDDWQLYGGRLVALQQALSNDLGLIAGQENPVLVFTDQTRVAFTAAAAHLTPTAIPAAVAQLRTALAHPGLIFCVGPKYFLPRRSTVKGRGDAVHLIASASRLLGDYHGRAIRQSLAGNPWLPLHVATCRREGATILLRVAGGDQSPLVVDTETVRKTQASTLGFRWTQTGGTPVQVAEVTVTGRDIIVQLTADPGSAGQTFAQAVLTIGFHRDEPFVDDGPLTGGRTNIRDTCPDVGSGGEPMHNWLCHDWFWETGDGSAC